MADRADFIESFVEKAGWHDVRRSPLAGDASFRRYERVSANGDSCVLMDAPPPHEDVRPFLLLAGHLRNLGYSAPRVLAQDAENGLVLLEDLGDDTYTRALAAGADERELYEHAIDLLIDLHSQHLVVAVPDGLEPYDDAKMLEEAALFTDWYLPNTLHVPTAAPKRQAFLTIFRRLLPYVHEVPETLVLRDFHADNLMWLPKRRGLAACGLLDFQDAVVGPTAYDVMSLLEDARRELRPGLDEAMLARYHAAFPGRDRRAFEMAYAILGAQRHCKVIGIFTRLAYRDRKFDYLKHIPRVWRLLQRSCRHPMLAPLREWLDANVPITQRTVPVQQRQA